MGYARTLRGVRYPDTAEGAELDVLLRTLAESIGGPFQIAAGTASLSLASGTDSSAYGVTLPVGRFTSAPLIIPAVATSTACWATYGAATTAGFDLYLHSRASATVTVTVAWVAIQMLTTSSAG